MTHIALSFMLELVLLNVRSGYKGKEGRGKGGETRARERIIFKRRHLEIHGFCFI